MAMLEWSGHDGCGGRFRLAITIYSALDGEFVGAHRATEADLRAAGWVPDRDGPDQTARAEGLEARCVELIHERDAAVARAEQAESALALTLSVVAAARSWVVANTSKTIRASAVELTAAIRALDGWKP
jgi:hypothetical protein